jgi:hypothetical protein
MYGQWRDFLLMMTLAATAATPASGQPPAPTAGPARSGTQTGALPDFSGIWSHLSLPGFEPPPAGPGPITNKSRLPNGVGNLARLVGDYNSPILKPEAAEVVKKHGELSVSGVSYPTPSNQCWPEPLPYIFSSIGMQMLQQTDKIIILYADDHEVRHVYLNQSHPARVTPSWYGDSVGHHEGDTLVIDTIGIKTDRPFAMVDWYGTPYIKALHVVERYRLLDYAAAKEAEERGEKENFRFPVSDTGLARDANYTGKGLQLEFTVDDIGVFTTPWSATITYRRPTSPLGEWPESACAEHPYGYHLGENASIPIADKPDF